MFRGKYQSKLLTILYSGGSNPLEIWDIQVKNGWTRRVKDEDMSTIVFEICGTNVATAYIVSPPDPKRVLGITLPFITMFIKNLKRYFTFEIQIMDDKHMRRRFRFSNYQSSTKVRPFTCSVPLALQSGWNQMQLNLANFTMRAYGTNYLETQRVQIHANCRVRRIYFSDRLYSEEELPRDYRIYLNVRQAPPPPPQQQQQGLAMQPQPVSGPSLQRLSQAREQAESKEAVRLSVQHQPVSKKPSKEEDEGEEALVSETSFRSKPSIHDTTSVARSSIKSKTSMRVGSQTEQRTTTEASKAGVESVSSRVSQKAEEGEVADVGEVREADTEVAGDQDEAEVGEIPLEELQPEQPEAEGQQIAEEAPSESAEMESPRTDVSDIPESEYAESEPVPESDAEVEEFAPEPLPAPAELSDE